ncbi:sugar phosphate isomerase/epimerase family protein [Jannaschia seohaensis]|uniref:Sugar phosphate isomerase/epimerase n=1 Tax=Jannaschia seohaensis TaxID=475081 RepID=A0A2Y9A9U7_9RHOB|nr:sugar phosphate isomerase/epimerase family protein [Jannaschia seohaensis]PWJ20884.1 sugar phosphate isomerase/epimerase [Jannaschia seohaensis]SSA41294.1 Sugar phosphate isomerase/epimerase [Jannaschia seohaensis]
MITRDRLALNTATLGANLGQGAGWSPERTVDACAARGFGGIVFWRQELKGRAQAIGEYARAAGLRVDGLCRTPYLTGPDASTDDELAASLDEAAALGAPVLTIVTGGTEPGTTGLEDSRKRLADRLRPACARAEAQGVRLALEPLNPMFGGNRTVIFTVADAVELAEACHPALAIAVDVYHVWWDRTLAPACARAGDRIAGLHLCDWLRDTSDILLDRGMMGDGVADIPAIRRAVEAAGYTGPCEVEIFSRDWWSRDPGDVLDTILDHLPEC